MAARRSRAGLGLTPTDSLVERFGLFTIIVLGEVVFGVVDGLSVAERDAMTITTGMIALVIGFGFWWIYFDLVGRRLPRASRGALANWMLSHLPITLSITAAGAGDGQPDRACPRCDARRRARAGCWPAPSPSGLLALILTERALADAERLPWCLPPPSPGAGRRRGRGPVVGWLRPAPWLLALLLVAILSALWFFAVSRFLRADAWGEP